ncbi:hypothetical protein BGX26_000169 [Mortierella sp. AD094]|nr:hypothetical protein BGX26_000169 [Mortierella sp. AD094]
MKFTLSIAVLALAASQAMAVVPIPVKECTKTVVVQPTDTGCQAFATNNGCTFDELLKWNTKLRTDCANLDVGAPLCVSVTPGAGGAGGAGSSSTHGVVTTAPAATQTSATHPATTTSAAKPSATSSTASNTTAGAGAPKIGSAAVNTNDAAGTKSSMVMAAAGVLVSVVYML